MKRTPRRKPRRQRQIVCVTLPPEVIQKMADLREHDMRRHNTDLVEVLIRRAHAEAFPQTSNA